MIKYKRDATFQELQEYCHFSGKDDYIELTEWHNGEGFDVTIHSKTGDKSIELSWGEFEAIKALSVVFETKIEEDTFIISEEFVEDINKVFQDHFENYIGGFFTDKGT